MNYGICQGGPINKKHLADVGEVFPIWHHPVSGKIITGLTHATWAPIGEYRFQNGEWTWTETATLPKAK